MTQLKHCKSCRFWERDPVIKLGPPMPLNESGMIEKHGIQVIPVSDSRFGRCEQTGRKWGPEFGCVLHEDRAE